MAGKLFEGFEEGKNNPASLVSLFEEEERQRQVAQLFNTKIELPDSLQEREKAFHDILLTVKRNSLEYYSSRLGSDVTAINQVLEAKKALEELNKTHISLQE